ncbi:hypothetical protein N9P44_01295 [Flavobacteriaceae bacterium]|nr:hypothetical protein [Flavobacteriaceae bacterium]
MIKIKHLGISIGIFGCLFKLMSWAGASTLLIMGLSLLGVFYLIKVFEKKKKSNVCRAKDCSCEDCTNGQPNT